MTTNEVLTLEVRDEPQLGTARKKLIGTVLIHRTVPIRFANANGSLVRSYERAISKGGEGGIRTLGTLAGTLVFETSTIGHSVTSPMQILETSVAALEGSG